MDDLELAARKICVKHKLQFIERVGEGAFKQTFRVADSEGIPSALKLYKAASAAGRDRREIKAMLRCKHDNIARLLWVENYNHKNQDLVAIAEEYLPGGTLTSKGQLTVSQCLTIGTYLIDAVSHIASLKLVHRDIKPDNIMFREDGKTPVITDFGVVRDLQESSMTPTWQPRGPGTPFFSAPEQLKNEKSLIDWRADQFALGVVLAYVVFGGHPYKEEGISDWEVVDRVSSKKPPSSWFLRRAAEFDLVALARMVAPWPVDRYRKPELLRRAWSEQKG
jgi:serine/threonine protein kinase